MPHRENAVSGIREIPKSLRAFFRSATAGSHKVPRTLRVSGELELSSCPSLTIWINSAAWAVLTSVKEAVLASLRGLARERGAGNRAPAVTPGA